MTFPDGSTVTTIVDGSGKWQVDSPGPLQDDMTITVTQRHPVTNQLSKPTVVVVTLTMYQVKAIDFTITVNELQAIVDQGTLAAELLIRTDAKAINTWTNSEERTGLQAEIIGGVQVAIGAYSVRVAADFNTLETFEQQAETTTNNVKDTTVIMTVVDDATVTSTTTLPTTGQTTTAQASFISLAILLLSLFSIIIARKRRHSNKHSSNGF